MSTGYKRTTVPLQLLTELQPHEFN